MAERIKYKSLGVRLQNIPNVQQTGLKEAAHGMYNLSKRLDQVAAFGWQAIETKTKLKASEKAEKDYKAYELQSDGMGGETLVFSQMPSEGTTVYEKAYYAAAQNKAKLQIKSLFEKKIYEAYRSNMSNVTGFNAAVQDIKDGTLTALKEKNVVLHNYFQYDFEQSIIPYQKTVYTNWAAIENDVETSIFLGYAESGHVANVVKHAASGDEASLAKAGVTFSNLLHDFISLAPSEAFISSGMVFEKDESRMNLRTIKEITKDLTYVRKNTQEMYLEEFFKHNYEGNPLKLLDAIQKVRTGEYETLDFFTPVYDQKTKGLIIGLDKTKVINILNADEREKLSKHLMKIFTQEHERKTKLMDQDVKVTNALMENASMAIIKKIANLKFADAKANISGLEVELTNAIDTFSVSFPTEEGQDKAAFMIGLMTGRHHAENDEIGTKEYYMMKVKDGMFDTSQVEALIKDRRLTKETKAKIMQAQMEIDLGEKGWRGNNLYKSGLAIINDMQVAALGGTAFHNMSGLQVKKSKKVNALYSDTHQYLIEERNFAIGNSGNRFNSTDIANVIKKLDAQDKLIATEIEYKKAKMGKDETSGVPEMDRYTNLKLQKNLIEEKIAKEKDEDKLKELNDKNNELIKQISEIEQGEDFKKITEQAKQMEFKKDKIYYLDNEGALMELTPNKIIEMLMEDPLKVIPEDRELIYKSLFSFGAT